MRRNFYRALIFVALISLAIKAECCTNNSYKRLLTAVAEKCDYYSVNEDVNLSGKTIELPKGAVIDFKGGIISNGTIIFNDNLLIGYSGIANNVKISGNIIGPLNISVFVLKRSDRQFDLGPIMNKAIKVCKNIIVPEGVFYLQTPIVLNDIKFYQQFGSLIYNGKSKDITVLQFSNVFTAVININGKVAYDIESSVINYTKAKRTNIIGIEFANVNNSRVYIGDVEYFNNNIRISAYGVGNCYNQYTINLSVFSNEHLRIYQEDKPSKQIGWCNENVFLGGRFCNWSHFDWKNCESTAIRIEGAQSGDTYNSANSILFIKPCMEGFRSPAVYAKNVTGCHWQDARTEDTKLFVKFVGNCRYNEVNSLYGTESVDYSECSTYPLLMKDLYAVYSSFDSSNKILEIDTKEAKIFKVIFNNKDAKARVDIQYLPEEEGRSITKTAQERLMRPRSTLYPHSYYYNADSSQWKLAADSSECDFVIPDGVNKIRIYLSGRYIGATVYSNKNVKVIEH